MSNLIYNTKALNGLVRATSIKSVKLEPGTVIQVLSLDELETDGDFNRDRLLCSLPDGRNISIPLREYVNYRGENGPITVSAEDGLNSRLPAKFTVVSSADREITRDGKTVKIYPLMAYNKGAEQIEKRQFDFDELLKGGLIEAHGYEPVQNYVIKPEFA